MSSRSPFNTSRRSNRRAGPLGSAGLGALIAFGLLVAGIVLGGNPLSFVDMPSLLIVLGGTIGGALLTYSLEDVQLMLPTVRQALDSPVGEMQMRMAKLVELAQRVKSEGTNSIEYQASAESDPFLRKSLELLVDNFSEEEFRKSLEIEYRNAEDKYRLSADILNTMGNIAPSMGLIGTIIGLVHMLHQLNSPEQIGPGMATALITTFYGAVLSFLVFNPLADKLRICSQEQFKLRDMTYEALLLIHQNLHPRIVEQRLSSFVGN